MSFLANFDIQMAIFRRVSTLPTYKPNCKAKSSIPCISPAAQASAPHQCQEGWQPIHRGCYQFRTDLKLSWKDASAECAKSHAGAQLLSIQSVKEKVRVFVHRKYRHLLTIHGYQI